MPLHAPRRPPWVRPAMLLLGFGLIGSGYWQLTVDPATPVDQAMLHAFLGMALVTAGAALALLSRWL